MTEGIDNVKVIRVRCNTCEQDFTLITTNKRKKFNEGETIGISCCSLKTAYPGNEELKQKGACSTEKELVYVRTQGERSVKETDVSLESLLQQQEEEVQE